jgi:hypothetical protein
MLFEYEPTQSHPSPESSTLLTLRVSETLTWWGHPVSDKLGRGALLLDVRGSYDTV